MNQGVTRDIRCRKLGFDTENASTKNHYNQHFGGRNNNFHEFLVPQGFINLSAI